MKKLILLLVLATALSVVGAFGSDLPTTIIVNEDITVDVGPATLDFGTVSPGTADNPSTSPIQFDATGSNVDVTVTVNSVTGGDSALFTNIEVETSADNWVNIVGALTTMLCDNSGGTCAYTPVSWDARLDVPPGWPAGTSTGTIVYTISGPP